MTDYIISYKFKKGDVTGKYQVTAKDKKHAFMRFQNTCMRLVHYTVIVLDIVEDI